MHPVLGHLKEQQARSLLRGSRGSGECCTSFPSLVRESKVTFTAFVPTISDCGDQRDIPQILPRSSVSGKTKLSSNLRHLWLGRGTRCHHLVCNFKRMIFYNCVGKNFMLES